MAVETAHCTVSLPHRLYIAAVHRLYHGWLQPPDVGVILCFDAVLDFVVQLREEVDAGDFLHFVNGFTVVLQPLVAGFIFKYEADALPVAVDFCKADFVEGVGHDHVVVTDGFGMFRHNRSARDIDIAVFFRPIADLHLQIVPVAAVQVVVLWADVGQIKALVHSGLVPLHIAGGSHVTTVVFG